MNSRPKEPENGKKQKYPGHRRLRQRQDAVLCEAEPDADAQLLCRHRPKGQLLVETGKMLPAGRSWARKQPVRESGNGLCTASSVLNTINFSKSPCTTTLLPICAAEKDILKLVTTSSPTPRATAKPETISGSRRKRSLYCALIGYIHYEAEPEEKLHHPDRVHQRHGSPGG